MGFTYDISSKHKDTTSSKCILICHMLGAIMSVFVSTFFIAHIFSFSVDAFDYIKHVGIYYIVTYLVFLVTNYFMSIVVDKTKRVGVYRLSLLLRLIVVIIMIFFGQNLVALIPLAGFMYGLGEGTYYASYNVLKQEMVSRKSMGSFATYSMILAKVMEIITPIGLGALISAASFTEAAIYVAIISAVIFIISLFIKSKKPESSSFNLWRYFRKLKEKTEATEKIKALYFAGFVYGMSTAMGALINVCIMIEFNSSFSLGSIGSIISAVALIEIFMVNKFTKPGKRSWMYVVSMILPIIGSLLFVIIPSTWSVVIFNLLLAISSIIFKTIYDIYRNGNLKEAGLYSEIAEHQVAVEATLAISRIVTFGIIIIVGLLKSLLAFKIILVLLSLSYTFLLYLLCRYEKKYENEKNL